MVEVDTNELVLLALRGDSPESDGEAGSFSAVELAERLEMGSETMADRIGLLSALSELIDEGLVEQHKADTRRVYALTQRGLDRAASVYESVADRRIEVHKDTSKETPLGEVDQYLSTPAVARALARLTDDDVLYIEDQVGTEFIDRVTECDAIAEHVSATRLGEGRVVMVTGEAGAGKTTLVRESLGRDDDLQILDGVARVDTDQPYQAVREAIEPALEESPFDRPALEPDDPKELQRFRTSLFADVANALLGLGQEGPVVLFLDDLHKAGEPTYQLVDVLARRVREGRVLLVAAARVEHKVEESGVRRMIDEVIDRHPHDRLELPPFDRERTRELIQVLLETREVPAAFVDLIYDHTGGTPLFIVEICSRMQEQEILAPEHEVYPTDADQLQVPETAEETIETRLDVLDEPGQLVLSTAALLGEEFAVEDLKNSAEIEGTTIQEYLDILIDVDILRWVESEDGTGRRVRFRSALYRETAVDRLSPDQRTREHQRIARVLDERGADSPQRSATVAHHYEQAGDDEQALETWLSAAEHAEGVYAHELARDHYEHALSIARDLDDTDRMFDILESIGDIEILVGDHEEARRSFEYVRVNAVRTDRKQRVARKIAKLQLQWEGNADAALETVESALALTEGDPSTVEECRLLLVRQSAASNLGNPELARKTTDTALELAETLGDRALRARSFRTLVKLRMVHDLGGIDDEVIEMGKQAIAIWENIGDNRHLAEGLLTLGTIYGMIGMVEESFSVATRALELNQQLGDRVGALNAEYMIVNRLLTMALNGEHPVQDVIDECDKVIAEARDLGNDSVLLKSLASRGMLDWQGTYDYESAVDHLDQAVEICGGYDHWAAGQITVTLASVHRDAGDFGRTRSVVDRLLERDRNSYGPKVRTLSHVLEATLAVQQGATDSATGSYNLAIEVASETDFEQGEVLARAGLVDALLATDRVESASEQTSRIGAYLADDPSHGPYPGDEPFTQVTEKPALEGRRALGRVTRAQGNHELALEAFETGLSTARDHDDRLREAEFLFEFADTYHERDDWNVAGECIEAALSTTSDLGAFGQELQRRYRDVIDGS